MSGSPDLRAARPSVVAARAAEFLRRHGVQSPAAEAETLVLHALGVNRADLYRRDEELSAAQARWLAGALRRRAEGEPLQHVTGWQRFLDLDLEVRPGVFVPRPETEVLVEVALEALDHGAGPSADSRVVVDVGTGTGAIALAVQRRRPRATVIATDVSAAAVGLARANARRLGLPVDARCGDLLDPLPDRLRGRIDLIVSNPPYVESDRYDQLPRDVRADPRAALVGGTSVHGRLGTAAVGWLAPDGWLVVEIGEDQGAAVRRLWERAGLVEIAVLPDLAGRDRVVRARRRGP